MNDDRFQLSRPGDFDVTLTSYIRCLFHVQFVFRSSLDNWRDNTTKLHLFLDDLFQPSPMRLVSVLTRETRKSLATNPLHNSQGINEHCGQFWLPRHQPVNHKTINCITILNEKAYHTNEICW